MNYEQLIEELREEMLQLVNTKCDALLQMYRSGELRTDMKDTIRESSLITVSPAELKGKKPLAVQFAPGEWIETPTWRKVAQRILQTCNEQPDIHERFMEMCGKVAGRWRTILGSSPEEMDGIKTPSLCQVWSFSFVHLPNVKIDCIKEMGKL